MNDVKARRPDWIGPIDGVRGLAALWVLVAHAVQLCGVRINLRPSIAVDIFMVISGFLMAHHFHRRQEQEPWEAPATWGKFYLRRFFRIAPLYYALLIPSLLFVENLEGARNQIDQQVGVDLREYEPATAANWLAHLTFAFGAIPRYHHSVVLPDWSIGLEMQFYLLFPFIMLLLTRVSPTVLALLAVVICVIARRKWGPWFELPSFLPLKIHIFTASILLAQAYIDRSSHVNRLLLVLLALALCAIERSSILMLAVCGLIALILTPGDDVAARGSPSWQVGRVRDLLGSRVGTLLAQLSYGVYLLHLLILIPLLAQLFNYPWFADATPLMRVMLVLPLAGMITCLGAFVLHHTLEKAGVAFGNVVVRRFAGRPAEPETGLIVYDVLRKIEAGPASQSPAVPPPLA